MGGYSGGVDLWDAEGNHLGTGQGSLWSHDAALGDWGGELWGVNLAQHVGKTLTLRLPTGKTGQVIVTRSDGIDSGEVEGDGLSPF